MRGHLFACVWDHSLNAKVFSEKIVAAGHVRRCGLLALGCASGEQPLAGKSWKLVSVGDGRAIGRADVEFSGESGISGWTECNSYDGRFSASGSFFTIEELKWTEAGCPSRALFTQESLYTDLLVDAKGFPIGGSNLTITSSDGQTITFTSR